MFKKLTLTILIGMIVILNVLLNIIEYYNDIIENRENIIQ